MEVEVLQTVLTEVLEELKEIKQKEVKLMEAVAGLNYKVDEFEFKLSNIKVTTPATNLEAITSTMNDVLLRIERMIEEQPKSTTTQYRILLFPEHDAREYYKIVFGRVLFCIAIMIVATYLFVLRKSFIEADSVARLNSDGSSKYKKVWMDFYHNSKKAVRLRMDSVWRNSVY